MNTFAASVEILLGSDSPEPHARGHVLIPLSSGEAYVAERGLPDRYKYYFDKEPSEESGLMAVYNFLTLKIDAYRSQARNIARALSEQNSLPREYRALAIASVMVAQEAKRSGWPKQRTLSAVQNLKFQETLALSPEAFAIARRQASNIALENSHYWVDKLTQSRNHRIAIELKESIDQSDHKPVEV